MSSEIIDFLVVMGVAAPFYLLMMFGNDLFNHFKSKRKDKLRLKELELEIVKLKFNKRGDSAEGVSDEAPPKIEHKSPKWYMNHLKVVISICMLLATVIVPIVLKYC